MLLSVHNPPNGDHTMRNATVNGIRQALNARGLPALNAAGTRKFLGAWERATEGDWIAENFPVAEHETVVIVTEDTTRVHLDTRTVTQDGSRVRVAVYGGRLPEASNVAGKIRAALNDYAQSRAFEGEETPGTVYTVCYSVDENYWDTVAEIMDDRTDCCIRDPWTGEYFHHPWNPWAGCCGNGHPTVYRNANTRDLYYVTGHSDAAVALTSETHGETSHIPHRVFRESFTPVSDDETATVASTDGPAWHDFRETGTYRKNPTVHSEYAANRYAAVRAALINSGFPFPHATLVNGVSTRTVSMGGIPAVLAIIASSDDIGARGSIGYVWVTLIENGATMILHCHKELSPQRVKSIRDALACSGWDTVPYSMAGHDRYRLNRVMPGDAAPVSTSESTDTPAETAPVSTSGYAACVCCGITIMVSDTRTENYCVECGANGGPDCPGSGSGIVFETAWHCPGGVCDGSGCTGTEHMPTDTPDGTDGTSAEPDGPTEPDNGAPLLPFERELLAGSGGQPATDATVRAWSADADAEDSDARAEHTAEWFAANAGEHCATVGHGKQLGTELIMIEHPDGTWSLDTVCKRCARYYVTYAGKVDTHTRAVAVPDTRAIFRVNFHVDLAVWPLETVDTSNGNTRHPGSADETRWGYYVINSAREVLAAGTDYRAAAHFDAARAALHIAGFIADAAEHAEYAARQTGECAEHDKPYAQCATERPVHAYADELGTFAGTEALYRAIMARDLDAVMAQCGNRYSEAQTGVERFRDRMRGKANDLGKPLGAVRWQCALMIARTIGAQKGESAATWYEFGSAEHAQKVIDGIDNGDPVIMDTMPYAPTGEWSGDYNTDALMSDLGLTRDDETDDGELWSAFADEFDSTAQSEVERAARAYVS